ncbi:MAG: hypothetical protein AB7T31_06260 [Gemmatimonadales bacterium]
MNRKSAIRSPVRSRRKKVAGATEWDAPENVDLIRLLLAGEAPR